MNCGVVEEDEDRISNSSYSPSNRQQTQHDLSAHSPLSITASTTTSFDSNHHSPSPDSHLVKELKAPSGLNLLVAALDAQDPILYRHHRRASQIHIDDDSYSQQHTSDEDTCGSEKRRAKRRRSTIPDSCKDEQYWEKRKRNNEAAKRSREKRRINDMAMEARLMELSRENNLLKHELVSVKKCPLPKPTPKSTQLPIVPADMAPVMGNPTPPEIAAHLASLAQTSFLPGSASAAGFVNPFLAAAMVPQAMLLQAMTQQQRQNSSPPDPFQVLESTANQQACLPLISADQHRQPSILSAALSTPASPGPPTASSFSDGKQYLRYKLLERQFQQQNITALPLSGSSSHGLNLLGSVISNNGAGCGLKPPLQRASNFQAPPPKRQRTVPSKMADVDAPLSLKECLSSLAVSMISPNAVPLANGEKLTVGRGSASPSNAPIHALISDEHHQRPVGDQGRQNRSNSLPSSTFSDDGLASIGDLLRARTHSDSSHSSTGISSLGSSTGGVSLSANGALSPTTMMELEFRNSLSDRRRDSNNSDSGIVSDGGAASDRRAGKRYRNDHERYVERRRRNNEAAKRCRANRRAMFEYRYQRAQELEDENTRLKDEMRQLSRELTELKELLSKRDGDGLILEDNLKLTNLINVVDDGHIDVDDEEFKEAALQIDFSNENKDADSSSRDEKPLDFTVKKENC